MDSAAFTLVFTFRGEHQVSPFATFCDLRVTVRTRLGGCSQVDGKKKCKTKIQKQNRAREAFREPRGPAGLSSSFLCRGCQPKSGTFADSRNGMFLIAVQELKVCSQLTIPE